VPIFELLNIEKQLKSLFGKTVSLQKGGYLVIEHTEALHVIDVNSGNKSTAQESQEETALAVNLEAAAEVARQLRMRDMGGIVVVDFIDMKRAEYKLQVFEKMRQSMAEDRAKHTILPITKFGLMQITRQRVRPEMNIKTLEDCPTCAGTGKIGASILISDNIDLMLAHVLEKQNEAGITLTLHPFLVAYYTKGFPSRRAKWFFKYKKWIKIIADNSLSINDFKFKNKEGIELELDKF
jgi:ribonuclease G